jgi:alkylation response protein AidB-like acyl-CoA dehydrogenase
MFSMPAWNSTAGTGTYANTAWPGRVDARVTKIWAGSNEIMKELIGRDLGL